MNYNILVAIVIAIFASVILAAIAKEFRPAFQVPEGYAGLAFKDAKRQTMRAEAKASVRILHFSFFGLHFLPERNASNVGVAGEGPAGSAI